MSDLPPARLGRLACDMTAPLPAAPLTVPDLTGATTHLDCALAYARAGFSIFPVQFWMPPGKSKAEKKPHPTLGKGGFRHATRNIYQIRKWWASLPDACIGWWPGCERCVVLDGDGKTGVMRLYEAAAGQLDLETTAQVRTSGDTGGWHCYFDRSSISGEIGNSKLLGPDGEVIGDVRSDSGFVVLPDTIHDYYELASTTREITPIPPWAAALIDTEKRGSHSGRDKMRDFYRNQRPDALEPEFAAWLEIVIHAKSVVFDAWLDGRLIEGGDGE